MKLMTDDEVLAGPKLLSDEEVLGAKAPSALGGFVDHMGDLLKNANMGGAITPEMVPSKPGEQFAISAALVPNMMRNAYLQYPDNLAALGNPQAQEEIRQLKGDRLAAEQALKEIQANDNYVQQLVGQAVQALPGSLASLAVAPLLPVGPALGVGLGMNFALEQSANFTGRMDNFGQSPERAWAGALPDSAVATGLEMLPMGAVMKYMKGAAPLGKTVLAVGGGEAIQEGGTTLFQDVHTNLEGLTDYGAGELAGRAGESAAVGALMAPMMGPFAGAAKLARVHGMRKEIEAEQQEIRKAVEEQVKLVEGLAGRVDQRMEELLATGAPAEDAGKIAMEEGLEELQGMREQLAASMPMRRVETPDGVILVPFEPTAEDKVLHAIQEDQARNGLDLEGTPQARAFGDELTEKLGQVDLLEELNTASPDEGGMSETVRRRRRAEMDPNAVPVAEKPIALSKDERAVGLTLKQAGMPADGSVTVVGMLGEHFPREVYVPMLDYVEELVRTYLPKSKIVLDLSVMPEDYFGKHTAVKMDSGDILHVITPMDMLNIGRHGKSDPRTAMSLLTAVTHEFGHAMLANTIHSALQGKLDTQVANRFYNQARFGDIDPDVVAAVKAVDPSMGKLLDIWADKRLRIFSGKMTAYELMDDWVGIRKLGFSVARVKEDNQSLYRWAGEQLSGNPDAPADLAGRSAKEVLLAASRRAGDKTPQQMKWLMAQTTFHEFMAEQFARAAYQTDAMNRAQFGSSFAYAMARLREMFKRLKSFKGVKGEKLIAPNTTFQEWLAAQTQLAKDLGWTQGKFELSPAILKKQKALAKKELAGAKKEELKKVAEKLANARKKKAPPKEQVAPPAAVVADQRDRAAELEQKLDTYEEYGYFEGKPRKLEKARGLLERRQFVELEGLLQEVLEAQGEYDREYTSKVLRNLPKDKAVYKRATLQGYYGRQDVKAAERKLWENYLAANPGKAVFTLAELEQALVAGGMPTNMVKTSLYTDAFATGSPSAIAGGMAQAHTYLMLGPYQTARGNSRHFDGEPNYLAHIRSYTRQITEELEEFIVEVQSDIFQTAPSDWQMRMNESVKDVGEMIDDVDSEIETLRLDTEELELAQQEQIEQLGAGPADTQLEYFAIELHRVLRVHDRNGLKLAKPNLETATWDDVQRFYEEMLVALDERRELLQEMYTAGFLSTNPITMREKLLDLRPTWYQRLVREFLALKVQEGKTRVHFPSLETLVDVEGWSTKATMERSLNSSRILLDNQRQSLEHQRAKLAEMLADPAIPLATLNDFRHNMQQTEQRLHTYEAIRQNYEQQLAAWGDNPVGKDYMPIYNFYKKELLPWVLKTYGSTEYVAKNGRTWQTVELTQAMQAVDMYDRDNPYAERLPGVVLDQYAGLTPEELRNPEMLAQAEAAWERAKVGSPFFLRWIEGTKVTQPVWGNGTSRALEDGGSAWVLYSNPANAQVKRGTQAARETSAYWVRMVNPKMVDGEALGQDAAAWELEVALAKKEGHDGLVVRRIKAPVESTQYVVFAPEQLARDSELVTPDQFDWDQESPGQVATQQAAKVVEIGWDRTKMAGLNLWAKVADNLVQLQQVAAVERGDYFLQQFVLHLRMGEKLKNKLMGHAEGVVKDLMSLGNPLAGDGAGTAVRKKLHSVLKAEWKSGELHGTLVGLNENGEVVWGGDAPTTADARMRVAKWEIQGGLKLAKFLESQGVDRTTELGARIEKLYLDVRNSFVMHFVELATSLKIKAARTYAGNQLMLNMEQYQIDQLMVKLLTSPFVPVGHFGNHVLVIKKTPDAGGRKQVIYKQHFESKTAFDLAHKRALAAYRGQQDVDVEYVELPDEAKKIPMQLPREFLERVVKSGEFTDEQVELLTNTMQIGKYDKVVEKYEKLSVQVDGGNEDFGRVFADFSWHNANYIWKTRFRMLLNDDIRLGKVSLGRIEADKSRPVEEMLALSRRRRRTLAIMENQKNYVLEPQEEYQQVRSYIALAYLAYGGKTALMNLSTNLNTMAAISYEFGELEGMKHYAKAWKNFLPALWAAEARLAGEAREVSPEMEPLVWAMEKALEEGIIDQSFAYFLAGQANADAFMRSIQPTTAGQISHKVLEAGMWPFRMVEKMNRSVAMLAFFSADVAEAKKTGMRKRLEDSYEKAVRRVDQTQNAYDAANRSKLFQGKKAILTMFMSYVQYQSWVMFGGMDRAIRADIVQENAARANQGVAPKDMPSKMRSPWVKLWLVYLLLAGPLGLPFAGNLLDLARWLWRKLWPTEDLEVTMRKAVQELGMDPNLAMHGFLHDFGGFNVSASFGLGRVIPGTDLLNRNFRNAEEFMGHQVKAMSGPAGSFYEAIISALILGANGEWAEAGKALPGAIGAVTKSMDAWLDQNNRPTYGVTTKDGKRLTVDLETGEPRDLTTKELVGMALGANPTMLAVNRELHFRVSSEVMYWNIRRSDLMDKYRKAVITGDEEGRDEVREAVAKFNSQVPHRTIRLTQKDLNDNLRTWRRAVQAKERHQVTGKMYRRLGDELEPAYRGQMAEE